MILKKPHQVLSVFNAHDRNESQKFRDLLGQVSQDSLGLWSDGNLCQIDRLAALIVDSVEESPYSIEVLQILCRLRPKFACRFFNVANETLYGAHVPSFRSTALKQRPILLYNLLTKAISSGPMFEKVCGLSLARNRADWFTVCYNMCISTFTQLIAA